jgi:hypothetical protein
MTTDPTSAADRAARIEALRQRRAAGAAPQQRSRRRHAAAGGRILAGGLSVAAALGLMGAMANATSASTNGSTATTATAGVPAAPTVIVIRRPAGATVAAPIRPQIAPTTAAPVATSRGS